MIPNLGVWVPPESDYASDASKGLTSGAGSTGIVLCVSEMSGWIDLIFILIFD